MTDASERQTSSSAEPHVHTGTSSPAHKGRKPLPFRRTRVGVLGVLALVLAASAAWRLPAIFDDDMQGPHGRFPPPIAAEPPLHSLQRVAVIKLGINTPWVIYGGLLITAGENDVRAVGIATGRLYWRYEHAAGIVEMDRSTGELLVFGDGLSMIEVRSGRVRWSRHVPDVGSKKVVTLSAGTDTIAIHGEDGIAGINRLSGKTRWFERWPGDCPTYDGRHGDVVVTTGIIAVACDDPRESSRSVVAFDAATGALRWGMDTLQLFPGYHPRANDPRYEHYPLGGLWEYEGRLAATASPGTDIIDPATGKVIIRRAWPHRSVVAFSGGIQLSKCKTGTDDALCASDPRTGEERWHSRVPGGGSLDLYNGVAVAGDRVYTVSGVASGKELDDPPERTVTVFDARTGKILSQLFIDGTTGDINGPITDGIIAFEDKRDPYVDDLYAERPDIRSPRDLSPITR